MVVNGHEMKPHTSPVSQNLLIPSSSGTADKFLDWIGENAYALDSVVVNEKFREAEILQHDERVAFAFKTGRDSLYMTNKRLLIFDVQVSRDCSIIRICCLTLCLQLFHTGLYRKEEGIHVCFVGSRSHVVSRKCW